jgi:peptidoglycan/xylan/chitin deacetylase (PgdA/CDA1 family)
MRAREPGRHCGRCGEVIRWSAVRFVGLRPFCGEPCAVLWLSDEAGRTAWDRAALEMERRSPGLRTRVRLIWASRRATAAQRRLDLRLDAGPRAKDLPWICLPSPRGAAAFLLVLIAWAAAGGRAPETRANIPPAPPLSPPAAIALIPPQPVRMPTSPSLAAPAPSQAPAERPAPIRRHSATRIGAEDITRGDLTAHAIAFTFDGGDEANVAGEILDILRARQIHTTMFLTGQFIRMYPDMVRRMVDEEHEIGNHLDTHPHLTTYAQNRRHDTLPIVTSEFLASQLRRADESLRRVTGSGMAPYWRAPYGEHNAEIRAWAAEAGYRHISWTRGAGTAEDLDTRDWVADRSSRIYRSREEISTRILEFGRGRPEGLNGGIILMHLASHRKTDRPHEGLPQLLRTLQSQGYRIVRISELLERTESRPGALSREAGLPGTPPPAP